MNWLRRLRNRARIRYMILQLEDTRRILLNLSALTLVHTIKYGEDVSDYTLPLFDTSYEAAKFVGVTIQDLQDTLDGAIGWDNLVAESALLSSSTARTMLETARKVGGTYGDG